MLKHTEILDKMSAKQKIALIANINKLADDEYIELGIPRVKFTTLDELFAKDGNGLSPYVLARTWNTSLISEVTEYVIERNCDDSNVILVPSPKINLGGENDVALSEDPLLSTRIVQAFLTAVNARKKNGIIPGYYLTERDIANLDLQPDGKVLNDFFHEPFSSAATHGEAKAIIGSMLKGSGAYEDFNKKLFKSKSKYFPEETDMLCLCRTYDETISAIEEGCIIFSGVESAVKNAYDQYLSIMAAVEKGMASMISLEEALEHRTAINEQMLDSAVDKVIDFAFKINKIEKVIEPEQESVTKDVIPEISAPENVSDTAPDNESPVSAPLPENEKDSIPEETAESAEANNAETSLDTAESSAENATDSSAEVKTPDDTAVDKEKEAEESSTPEQQAEAPISDVANTATVAPVATELQKTEPTPVQETKEEPIAEEEAITQEEYEGILAYVMEKSTVMLKNNDKILPFNKSKSFAIIGDSSLVNNREDATFAEYFVKFASGNCIGIQRGYDLNEDRSDDLLSSAVSLAQKASTVFVFLKPREATCSFRTQTLLPANQLALIHALSKCKCKLVAIMSGVTNVDVSFAEFTDALIFAPVAGRLSAVSLANIIFNRASAGGKLTTTSYIAPNQFYKKQRFYKDNGRNKVGIFIGYRYYDSQAIEINYPFGFGLKYSDIEISNAKWGGGSIRFTATNKGPFDVEETVEIYIGLDDSKLVRPKKELKAFCTLSLKAGKSKQVTIENLNFKVYNDSFKSAILESGYYTIYIGTSSSNIKATVTAAISGEALSVDYPDISDYLQSKTNIISKDFTLEAKHKKMANHKTLKSAGLICLLVAILVGLMSLSSKYPLVPLAIGAAILITSIGLLVASRNIKIRIKNAEADLIEKNKRLFQNAELAETKSLENLFLKEFKADTVDPAEASDAEEEFYANLGISVTNDKMSFALAAADFKKSASEAGVIIDNNLSASLITSFVASRLILVKGETEEKFEAFIKSVANYFDAKLFTESLTEAHNPAKRLLFTVDENDALTPTEVMNALICANDNPQQMHIVYLKNVKTENMSDYLIPYIKYFSNPNSNAEISVKGSSDKYSIPSNVWFVIKLEKGSLAENIPAYILEHSALLPVSYTEAEPEETKTEFVPITIADFDLLSEKCKLKYTLNEEIWKKIDSIEAFAFKNSEYKIGNKLWLKAETYISAMLSIENEPAIVIDRALASIILPPLASSLVGKIEENEKTLIDELERVFGEENIPISHDMLISKA